MSQNFTPFYPITSVPNNTRYRKPFDYVRHYTPELRNPLESGDLILIEPRNEYGYYFVDPRFAPRILVDKSVNIATRFTTPIPKLTSAGATAGNGIPHECTEIDVSDLELAIYKILVIDPDIQVQVSQPSASTIFNDKVGGRRLAQNNTLYHAEKGDWAAVPEITVFQDDTPVNVTATSTNMNEDTYWARLRFLGWKFKLFQPRIPKNVDYAQTIMTLNVGARQN